MNENEKVNVRVMGPDVDAVAGVLEPARKRKRKSKVVEEVVDEEVAQAPRRLKRRRSKKAGVTSGATGRPPSPPSLPVPPPRRLRCSELAVMSTLGGGGGIRRIGGVKPRVSNAHNEEDTDVDSEDDDYEETEADRAFIASDECDESIDGDAEYAAGDDDNNADEEDDNVDEEDDSSAVEEHSDVDDEGDLVVVGGGEADDCVQDEPEEALEGLDTSVILPAGSRRCRSRRQVRFFDELLLDEEYQSVRQEYFRGIETIDDDGDDCGGDSAGDESAPVDDGVEEEGQVSGEED